MTSKDYLSGLADYIAHLIAAAKKPARRGTESERPIRPDDQASGRIDVLGFEGFMRKFAARRGGTADGAVHFLGLAQVRAHFGERWSAVAAKAHEIARQAIERRLSEKDLYTLYNDEGYIVVFSSLTKETAQMKCGLIAQEISRRLFGANDSQRIDIATVGVDEAGNVSSEAVTVAQLSERAVARKRAAATEVEVPSNRPPVEVPPIPRSVMVGGTADGIPSEADRGRLFSPERIQFVYRPMWQVRRKVISAYICIPAGVGADGAIRLGGAAMPLTHASPENAALDGQTMGKVIEDLGRLAEGERKLILVAPVHYFTVNDPNSGPQFARLCGTLSEDLRKLLVFELLGVPSGAPSTALMGALSRLKPFSRAVLVRQRLDSKDFSRFRSTGIFGIGADIGNVPLSEEQVFEHMDRFNRVAKAHGLTTYVHGLRSRSLVSTAAGAGFSFIDGDPVMSVIDMPESVSPFQVENLYASLLASAG